MFSNLNAVGDDGKKYSITIHLDKKEWHRIAAWIHCVGEDLRNVLYAWDPILIGDQLTVHLVNGSESSPEAVIYTITDEDKLADLEKYIHDERWKELEIVQSDWESAQKKADRLHLRIARVGLLLLEKDIGDEDAKGNNSQEERSQGS